MPQPDSNSQNSKPNETRNNNVTATERKLTEAELSVIEALSLIMERLSEPHSSTEVKLFALESLKTQLRSSPTSSSAPSGVASVPLGLRFMKDFYPDLVKLCDKISSTDTNLSLSIFKVLSYLAIVYGEQGVAFKFLRQVYSIGGPNAVIPTLEEWGHEYAKRISVELINQENLVVDECVDCVIKFFFKHHSEPEACDILIELDCLDRITSLINPQDDDIHRICLYLQSCVPFEPCPEDRKMLQVIYDLYSLASNMPMSLIIAIKLGRMDLIQSLFAEAMASDPLLAKQFAFMLARHRINVECQDPVLREILFNGLLSKNYLQLAQQLEILPPKSPEDIYKSHLVPGADNRKGLETPKGILASCIVSAFVNAGFGSDTLLIGTEQSMIDTRVYLSKFKDSALVNAVASLGGLCLWNLDKGLALLDGFMSEPQFLPGALLGIGLLHSGIRNETDPALALIRESLQSLEWRVRQTAALGTRILLFWKQKR